MCISNILDILPSLPDTKPLGQEVVVGESYSITYTGITYIYIFQPPLGRVGVGMGVG